MRFPQIAIVIGLVAFAAAAPLGSSGGNTLAVRHNSGQPDESNEPAKDEVITGTKPKIDPLKMTKVELQAFQEKMSGPMGKLGANLKSGKLPAAQANLIQIQDLFFVSNVVLTHIWYYTYGV